MIPGTNTMGSTRNLPTLPVVTGNEGRLEYTGELPGSEASAAYFGSPLTSVSQVGK